MKWLVEKLPRDDRSFVDQYLAITISAVTTILSSCCIAADSTSASARLRVTADDCEASERKIGWSRGRRRLRY